MPTWRRVRSGEFFRAKAKWYRDMADHAAGVDKEKMLATAREFDTRAAATVGPAIAVQPRVPRGRRT